MTTFSDVAEYIGRATDAEVRTMFDLGNARVRAIRAVEAAEAFNNLKPGDKALLKNLKPKYLNGVQVIVTAERATKTGHLHVRIDPDDTSTGAFQAKRFGEEFDVSAGCLTKIG